MEEIKGFSKRHYLSKTGEGPGGKLNGPCIQFVLKYKVLTTLEESIPESSSPFFNYLRSIKYGYPSLN